MKKLLALIFLFPNLAYALAQPAFDPASLERLSNEKVMAFAQDDEGYMWIGTRHGLNRYNGSTYRKYFQGDSLSLVSDRVEALLSDTDNRIWVGTYSGVELVQNGTVASKQYPTAFPVYSMIHYDNEHLLISDSKGIELFDKRTGELRNACSDPRVLQSYFMKKSYEGDVWIAGYGKTRSILVLDENLSIRLEILLPQPVNITGLVEISEGKMAVSTDGGFFLISTQTFSLLRLPENLSRLTRECCILFVVADPWTGNTIIGVADSGIYVVDATDWKITRIWTEESLAGCDRCVCHVTEDNLWISKDFKSFSVMPKKILLESIPFGNMASDESVSAILPQNDDGLLVFTNERVFRIDLSEKIPLDVTPSFMSGQIVGSVIPQGLERAWIAMRGKVAYCSLEAQVPKLLFFHSTPDRKSLWDDGMGGVMVMYSDGISNIHNDGREERLLDRDFSGVWKCVKHDDSNVYIMGADFVCRMDSSFRVDTIAVSISLPTTVERDIGGNLWIGSFSEGLAICPAGAGTVRYLTTDDGLPDNSVRMLVAREDGMVVCARDQIARIMTDGLDISSVEISPIVEREFMFSKLPLEDGQLALAAADRVVIYDDNRADARRYIKMELDGISVNNQFNAYPEQSHVFNHRERVFRFYFSGSDKKFGAPPNYEYMMQGFDKDWVYSGRVHRASYSNLKGGRYTFLARVAPSDTRAQSDILSYSFRVKTSPWLTWPALFGYLIAVSLMISYLARTISTNRRHKAQIERAAQERALIARVNKDKVNFFVNVSHEFRTPLSLIYDPIKELKRCRLSEQSRELVNIIDSNAERMLRLVDQLLAFNRSQSEKDGLSVMQVSISQRLESLLNDFSYLFENKNIVLSRKIESNVVGWCDSEKFERIVFNLLSNAAKYTPDGGKVHVNLNRTGDMASVDVADTGIGISDEDKKRIFGRFERVDSMETDPGGFGIGLNFAQHLARRHKGEISVHDNDPQGSVFSYVFPLNIDAYNDAEIWSVSEERDSLDVDENLSERRNSHLVLIVEDNRNMRHYLTDILREEYDVMTASNGLVALERVKTAIPDIVVSDVMMPGMDGFVLLDKLKNNDEYCHIPVVLLTAKTDMDSQLQGLGTGADAYISKPFERKYLKTVLKGIFDNRQRIQKILSEGTSVEEVKQEQSLSPRDKAFMDKLYAYLEEHAKEESLTITEICTHLGMSRTSVWSKIQTLFGVPPQTLILNFRLNKAMKQIREGSMNVSEVAYSVGFGSLGGFSRAFKTKFGVTPSSVLRGE